MGNILLQVAFLAVLSIPLAYVLVVLLRAKAWSNDKVAALVALFAGSVIILYIRFLVHNGSSSYWPDESNYINLLRSLDAGNHPPVSGPGFTLVAQVIHQLTGLEYAVLMPVLAALVGSCLLFIIYLTYRSVLNDKGTALISCLLLLATSYAIFPMIEARPQQLGMFLFLFSVLFFDMQLRRTSWFYSLLFVITSVTTFYYHILSFIILVLTVGVIFATEYLRRRLQIKQVMLPLAILGACAYIYTSPWGGYGSNLGAIIYSTRPLAALYASHSIALLSGCLVFALSTLVAQLHSGPLFSFVDIVARSKYFMYGVAYAVASGLLLQYALEEAQQATFYHHSFLYFLFFQAGNIVFGLLFLHGFSLMARRNEADSFFPKYSFSIMVVGFILLVPSLFLGHNFNNWLIRIINYWTLLAAPVAFQSLRHLRAKCPSNKAAFVMAVILVLMILISIINASRDPSIFAYRFV